MVGITNVKRRLAHEALYCFSFKEARYCLKATHHLFLLCFIKTSLDYQSLSKTTMVIDILRAEVIIYPKIYNFVCDRLSCNQKILLNPYTFIPFCSDFLNFNWS